MLPILKPSSPEFQMLRKSRSTVLQNAFAFIRSHVSLYRCTWFLIAILFQISVTALLFSSRIPLQSLIVSPPEQRHQLSLRPHNHHQQGRNQQPKRRQRSNGLPKYSKECESGMVYVYELPPMFNKDLLDNCDDLDPWHSRCPAVSNDGFGPKATELSGVVPETILPAWYWTDMFAGEVMFHARMMKHKCRTTKPKSATAFYIPFYAGLAIAKYLFTNYSNRDRDWQCEKLLSWVQNQTHWKRSKGSDHFIMLGRMTWDFRREANQTWGSSFVYMPAMEHITRLSVERNPWDDLEISIPYPTGFHPRSKSDVDEWVNFVRSRNRSSLFTFVGGKRNKVKNDFRALLLSQCYHESGSCRVVDCAGTLCYDGTSAILEAFLDSDFCLQPRGDAHTRRSTFDCMLAGSIPVFFWKRSIYDQYEWFLTDRPDTFSVFIDRNEVRNGTSIRKVLEGYSRDEITKMREKVIEFIPRFVYSVSNDDSQGFTDAFDIVLRGVLRRFKKQRRKENVNPYIS